MASSEQKRQEIKQFMHEGKTKKEISDIFLQKYGPTVLISPPFSGFNILAWTVPFVVIIVAGYLIYLYISRRDDRDENDDDDDDNNDDGEIEDDIEAELLNDSLADELKKYR